MDKVTGHYPPAQWYASIARCEKCGNRMDIIEAQGFAIWVCSMRRAPKNKRKRWAACNYSPHMESWDDYQAYLRGECRDR